MSAVKDIQTLKPLSSHSALFVKFIRNVYDMGVFELDRCNPENDALCLALSNALDELASLIGVYDLEKGAVLK